LHCSSRCSCSLFSSQGAIRGRPHSRRARDRARRRLTARCLERQLYRRRSDGAQLPQNGTVTPRRRDGPTSAPKGRSVIRIDDSASDRRRSFHIVRGEKCVAP